MFEYKDPLYRVRRQGDGDNRRSFGRRGGGFYCERLVETVFRVTGAMVVWFLDAKHGRVFCLTRGEEVDA